MRQKLVASVFAMALVSSGAIASVNMKNGNFFIGYTDMVYSDTLKVERVFNNKTKFKGRFGAGWGTDDEKNLKIYGDGTVVLNEYGGGAEIRFSPSSFDVKSIDTAVTTISTAAQKAGMITSPAQLAEFKKKLKADAQFRTDQWDLLRTQGKLEAAPMKDGTQLVTNQFSFQYITKVAGGYVRTFENGKIERFDNQGRLTRAQDKNGNFVDYTYGADGKLAKIQDNFNRKIFLTYNSAGFVEKIQGESGKTASYKYNGAGQLVESRDVDNHIYKYKYDGVNNMTEIAYQDKTTLQLGYYGKELFWNVKRRKDRDGTVSEYVYDYDKKDRGHSKVAVVVKGADGKQISKSAYEYFLKYKPNGEEWTYKLISELEGDRTETIYSECCGQPLVIRRGSEETTFEYDTKGHVTKKTTPYEVTRLSYHPKAGKVTKVERFSKSNAKDVTWSEFQYDDKGNLTLAKNSKGEGVRLVYDRNGRIQSLVDQARRQIRFEYNENSKPIRISDPQVGTMTISYRNSGEIDKVESSGGRKVASQVSSAVQNLMKLIKPAGVSLSF